MKLPSRIYISILVFIWFGYVAGISFLEAPLKFQAPGITLPLGLGIGRIVFSTLNKVELIFALATSLLVIFRCKEFIINFLTGLTCLTLCTQTIWLLPFLDARAETIINGNPSPPSGLHFVYIAFEAVKLILLFVLGIKNLQSTLYDLKK